MSDAIYWRSEAELWTVGWIGADGKKDAESDHGTAAEAAARVHYLNGGCGEACAEKADAAEVRRRVRELARRAFELKPDGAAFVTAEEVRAELIRLADAPERPEGTTSNGGDRPFPHASHHCDPLCVPGETWAEHRAARAGVALADRLHAVVYHRLAEYAEILDADVETQALVGSIIAAGLLRPSGEELSSDDVAAELRRLADAVAEYDELGDILLVIRSRASVIRAVGRLTS